MPEGKQIIEETVLNGGLIIRSCQGWVCVCMGVCVCVCGGGGVYQIHFSVIFFYFSSHEGTLEHKALTKIMEVLILELNS